MGDDDAPPSTGGDEEDGPARARSREQRLRERFARQWADVRAARRRRAEQPPEEDAGPDDVVGDLAEAGTTDLRKAQVPYGIDLAAAWSWRLLVVAAATGLLLYLLNFFLVVVLPLAVALFVTALAVPVVHLLQRVMPRKLAALIVVLGGLVVVSLLLSFVGQQVAGSVNDLSGQVVSGLEEIRHWLRTGPLHATDSQINDYIGKAQDWVKEQGGNFAGALPEVGTAVGHVVAGVFIVLFATYFFMADGPTIWAWLVRLFPRQSRRRADSAGRVAWRSLTQFVRATVLVAATDAVGVMIWATAMRLPLVSAIGVLVFLGAFVPMIGATLSGTVAVLVALVAKGPIAAVIMLAGVIVVQQLEAHVLQPFLMGRFVRVHPLGVIVAIACGVIVAGIPGALIAVPLAAAGNAVVQHLAAYEEPATDPGGDGGSTGLR